MDKNKLKDRIKEFVSSDDDELMKLGLTLITENFEPSEFESILLNSGLADRISHKQTSLGVTTLMICCKDFRIKQIIISKTIIMFHVSAVADLWTTRTRVYTPPLLSMSEIKGSIEMGPDSFKYELPNI